MPTIKYIDKFMFLQYGPCGWNVVCLFRPVIDMLQFSYSCRLPECYRQSVAEIRDWKVSGNGQRVSYTAFSVSLVGGPVHILELQVGSCPSLSKSALLSVIIHALVPLRHI